MSQFWSVFRYEFLMSIRRKGLWLAYGLLFLFYFVSIIIGRGSVENVTMPMKELWTNSAILAFMFNLLLPVVGGISAADRLVRDRNLRVDELLSSTSLTNRDYLAGKYFGVLTSLLLPVFICQIAMRIYTLFLGVPFILLGMTVVCFFVITVPAYAFITAFSLACPLVMPVRVYQVLFTGYWFWGNFLSPDVFPSLSGTLLQPGGKVAMEGLFGLTYGGRSAYGPTDVLINLALLAICIVAALLAANQFLIRKSRLA
jgi:ABC-2 type transport system permease protein